MLQKYSRENLGGRRLRGSPRKIRFEDLEEYLKKKGEEWLESGCAGAGPTCATASRKEVHTGTNSNNEYLSCCVHNFDVHMYADDCRYQHISPKLSWLSYR